MTRSRAQPGRTGSCSEVASFANFEAALIPGKPRRGGRVVFRVETDGGGRICAGDTAEEMKIQRDEYQRY